MTGCSHAASMLGFLTTRVDIPDCALVQFWGPPGNSETGTRRREANPVTKDGSTQQPDM